jgi:hypothetical protein
MLFLDTELTRLSQLYQKLGGRYSEVESDMYGLQDELDDIESSMDRIVAQIETVKEKLLQKKMSDINVFTDDKFTNDFIRASYFAAKGENRPGFQCINITDSELQASDTHRLIIVKCPCIPDELKNTKIKWDVRDNFKDHIKTDVEFPNVNAVIPSKEGATLYPGANPENFYTLFNPKPLTFSHNNSVECVKINFGGVNIGLNKEYLDTALMCIGGEFDLYVRGQLEALTLESKDTTVLLLPVRHTDNA